MKLYRLTWRLRVWNTRLSGLFSVHCHPFSCHAYVNKPQTLQTDVLSRKELTSKMWTRTPPVAKTLISPFRTAAVHVIHQAKISKCTLNTFSCHFSPIFFRRFFQLLCVQIFFFLKNFLFRAYHVIPKRIKMNDISASSTVELVGACVDTTCWSSTVHSLPSSHWLLLGQASGSKMVWHTILWGQSYKNYTTIQHVYSKN